MDGYLEWQVSMLDRVTMPSGEIKEIPRPLTYHYCTEQDKHDYLFEFDASQAAVEEGLWPNLLCLDDPAQVNLNGHGTTVERSVVTYDLVKCRNKPTC